MLKKILEGLVLVDLQQAVKSGKNLSDLGVDKISVEGDSLQDIYTNFLKTLDNTAENVVNGSWEETYDDPDEGEVTEEVERKCHEVYLGYSPKKDVFVSAFDVFTGDDESAGIVLWKIKNAKGVLISDELDDGYVGVYGSNGWYSKGKDKNFKDIIDIRLD